MIDWSDGIRRDTPAFFCQEAYAKASKPIVIVSDIRRRTDVAYFRSLQSDGIDVRTVRLFADDSVRIERGWQFQAGVDDVASECDLDTVSDWDFEICNETTDGQSTDKLLSDLIQLVIPILEEETQF